VVLQILNQSLSEHVVADLCSPGSGCDDDVLALDVIGFDVHVGIVGSSQQELVELAGDGGTLDRVWLAIVDEVDTAFLALLSKPGRV